MKLTKRELLAAAERADNWPTNIGANYFRDEEAEMWYDNQEDSANSTVPEEFLPFG